MCYQDEQSIKSIEPRSFTYVLFPPKWGDDPWDCSEWLDWQPEKIAAWLGAAAVPMLELCETLQLMKSFGRCKRIGVLNELQCGDLILHRPDELEPIQNRFLELLQWSPRKTGFVTAHSPTRCNMAPTKTNSIELWCMFDSWAPIFCWFNYCIHLIPFLASQLQLLKMNSHHCW